MGNIRKELEEIKQTLQDIKSQSRNDEHRKTDSYVGVVGTRKQENIIIKPKVQQESEVTKNRMIDKVNIKYLLIEVSKLAKGNKGSLIGCQSGKEVRELKEKVETAIGEEFNVILPKQKNPKVKIIGVDLDES